MMNCVLHGIKILAVITLGTLILQHLHYLPFLNSSLSACANSGNTTNVSRGKQVNVSGPQTSSGDDFITFGQAITNALDWNNISSLNEKETVEAAKKLFHVAFDYAVMEPRVAINTTCRLPTSSFPPIPDHCSSQISEIFTGMARTTPRRVGHAIQLGFDVDTLEIHLRELQGVVDKVFIIEWNMPHNQILSPKPLAWEAVKRQERFAFATDDFLVHLLMDDLDSAFTDPNNMWSVEGRQEQTRWNKIKAWNEQTNYFGKDDLIGFGDTDEIASRNNIYLLKHCEWKAPGPVDVGIYFPIGTIDSAFRTDFPVSGHPYSLGDPTFFTWDNAIQQASQQQLPNRRRGKSPFWILGGAHMTNYGYLGYKILKSLSCSECAGTAQSVHGYLMSFHDVVQSGRWADYEQQRSELPPSWEKRTISVSQLPPKEQERLVYVPWFYNCNRGRYSMWEGITDSRVG